MLDKAKKFTIFAKITTLTMPKTKDYNQMTLAEFIETELFREHLEGVLNNLLHGYNEIATDAHRKGKEPKKAPLINLVQEGLLDDTDKFLQEYYLVLGKVSTRTSGERTTIREIGDEAFHEAIASLQNKK